MVPVEFMMIKMHIGTPMRALMGNTYRQTKKCLGGAILVCGVGPFCY